MIIDEFQNLDLAGDGERIFKLMEQVMDEVKAEGLRIFSYIFIGSQVNAMEDIFIKRHFFYRRATRLKLGKVDEREIVEHIIKGFLASGKVIDRDLISGACRLFKCNLSMSIISRPSATRCRRATSWSLSCLRHLPR